MSMIYRFEWDTAKEKQNKRKHGIDFRQAATVFRDPSQLSIYDEDHSNYEERWITIGLDSMGVLRIVVHTFEILDESLSQIRLISALKATFEEAEVYGQRRL